MIKFFRKIRQQLLTENKFSKYLLYAIGEIILVVIGIFIALQLNNWNQDRVASAKEQLLLSELHDEFVNNKKQLEEVVRAHHICADACDSIIALFPIDLEQVNLDSLQEWMYNTRYHYTFNPSQGVINSLVNTSSFELISNDSLRRTIISWSDVLADYQEEEIKALRYFKGDYIKHWQENFDWQANLRDERNNLVALTTLQFEFHIQERQRNVTSILTDGELVVIQHMIDRIIELSEPEKP